MGSLIHDCAEGSYQFWCRNKQFKVVSGGSTYRATRKRVRVRYKQAPAVAHYEYVPQQKVVVYEPQAHYVPETVYAPQVVYEVKRSRQAVIVPSYEVHARPTYEHVPQRPVYEGPVTTTEETVQQDYDGHGILVYRPKPRTHRHKRKRIRARTHQSHYVRAHRKHTRKRRYRRRAVHSHYQAAPAYHYGAEQPTQVIVVKRRRNGRIHRKIPLFGSKSAYGQKTYRRKTVRRVKHRRVYRRACTPCGHGVYKKRRH